MKKCYFFTAAAIIMLGSFCCGGAEGVVNASLLNARVFPDLKAPVAVKIKQGTKVEITGMYKGWLEITAPDFTPVFADAAMMDGKRALRDMHLRIKPHRAAAAIGFIKRGESVKAVSAPDRFGWVQLSPLANMRVYVYKVYVDFDESKVVKKPFPAPAPKAAEAKAAPAPKAAEAKAAPAPKAAETKAAPAPKAAEAKAAPKTEYKLSEEWAKKLTSLGADTRKQEKFQSSGRLVAVQNPNSDCTSYAMVNPIDGKSIAFVFADAPTALNTMVEKEIKVEGIAYRVAGWHNRLVHITKVIPAGENK